MPDTLTHLVKRQETIDLMTSLHSDNVIVSFPIVATNPYERFGNQVRMDVFNRCQYDISYGKTHMSDRCTVFHTVGA
jgi:hypothetical protein